MRQRNALCLLRAQVSAAPRGDAIDLAALTVGMCPNWRGGQIFAADARGPMRAAL